MVSATLVLFAVAVGAAVQGSIGFGYALVVVPTMALIYPEAVPVAPLLLALPMTVIMATREWRSVDFRGFFLITAGNAAGTAAGVALLVFVPPGLLTVSVGLLIAGTALTSFLGPAFEVDNKTRLAGGMASGVMSTTASLGGPPLALIYQDRSGPELRSTLAISFVAVIFMSLAGLAFAGEVEARHLVMALWLLPGLLVGLWASRWFVERLDERWLRPAILVFASTAGLAVVVLELLR